VELVRSDRRRTIAIQVERDGRVRVFAPTRAAEKRIRDWAVSRAGWVLRHLNRMANAPAPLQDKPVRTPASERLVRERTSALLRELVPPALARAIEQGTRPLTSWSIRRLRSRWGSCTSQGHVTFNSRLSELPRELAEYIVCHEFAHLKELNHSPKFHALLDKLLPDQRLRRRELRKWGGLLD
jgi:predicted metal-dependent hydrolase